MTARRAPPVRIAAAAAIATVVLGASGPAGATRFRRPYAQNLSFNYGFDHGGGAAEVDWNCGGRAYDGHTGTDFPLAMGTPVLAPASGRVIATNQGCADWGYLGNTCGGRCGNYVQLSFADGTTALLCHMQNGSLTVSTGQSVACGQVLGRSASSGSSTGPHLHFAWRSGGVSQDPYAGPCSRATSMWVDQNGYWDAPGDRCECDGSPEVCNGADDDCDGAVDEDLTRPCGSDVGACRRGTERCAAGHWGACTGGVGPTPETCDAADNDCDGATDEDLVRVCGTDVGLCEPGTERCAAGGWGACVGAVLPVPERCDDQDNDCDGANDDEQVCEREEITFQAAVLDAGSRTDVDGDGRADACAREAGEVRCYLASGRGFDRLVLGPALSGDAGWDDPAYGTTLRLADLDGDGRADLCARGADGVTCWRSRGTSFGRRIVGPPLGDAAGWAVTERYSTIRVADANGDGRDDLCARDAAGFRCWLSDGEHFGVVMPLGDLSDAAGWTDVTRYGTIRMDDVDGDGRDDLCARDAAGVRCWLARGLEGPEVVAGPPWSDAAGWGAFSRWSTIRLADIDGDARADLCGRDRDGIVCARATGGGFAGGVRGPALSDAAGWDARDRFPTLRVGDVDGDRRHDLCALVDGSVACWLWSGDGLGRAVPGPALPDPGSWTRPDRHRTLRLADVDGDGRDDVCARAGDGLRCWLASGVGFPREVAGPRWTDADGWSAPASYGSIRLAAGARPAGAFRDDGLRGGCAAAASGRPARGATSLAAGALVALLGAVTLRLRRRPGRDR